MKLIDKNAALAIIEKFMYDANQEADIASTGECFDKKVADAKYQLCKCIRGKINSLEAKEVGLPNFEQEVKDFCYSFDDRKEAWYKMTPHDQNLMVSPTFANFAMQLAKHFFELGLSVNNPVTAADRGTAEEIIINLKRVEQDYRIDLTKEIEWVRNQVKKGE